MLFLGLFISIIVTAVLELRWSGVSIEDLWRNEQFWVIGGVSAHLFAVFQGLLKMLAGIDTNFTVTAKAADDTEFGELYMVKWTTLLIPPTTLIILNMVGVVAGFSDALNKGYEAWGPLFGKVFFAFWVILHLYPFLKGLMGRQNRTPTIVVLCGLYVILGNMRKLKYLTISNANVTGSIPKHLHFNLTHVDLSGNKLKGRIPSSISILEKLEMLNLSSNALTGEIPTNFGDLISLKNVSLGSNSLSGSIPDSMSAIPGLVHVDLSSNQLNGTIPRFFSEMKHLRYLNLANNEFHGVLPFNLGIAPCDKHGLPMSPPPAKDSSGGDSESDSSDYGDSSEDDSSNKGGKHHGPNKVVLGVAIGLSSIVFLIVFLILLSKGVVDWNVKFLLQEIRENLLIRNHFYCLIYYTIDYGEERL
ncbi:hypothetical protein GH714_003817 [Hevea brasiliensis]|uniref:Uncharacterized protein n=1 Tax=Hevea brasiliensis TaxID=3981 RepID=A0A6A6MC80_HEVBR|nr:hypothetical protein GH714_003817 [Hevea brasiliensis]